MKTKRSIEGIPFWILCAFPWVVGVITILNALWTGLFH